MAHDTSKLFPKNYLPWHEIVPMFKASDGRLVQIALTPAGEPYHLVQNKEVFDVFENTLKEALPKRKRKKRKK